MIFLTLARVLSRGAWRWFPGAALLLLCGAAQADALFGGSAVGGCGYDGASQTYSCTFLPSGYITVNSGYTVNIAGSASMNSAQIDGTLNIGGSLDISNHGIIKGSLSVAGAVSLDNHVQITGNLDAGGDISIATQSEIDGNLSGHNVVIHPAQTKIAGNASVYSIIIGNNDEVDGTITCTAPGASGCSCVTDNSGHGGWTPTCGAAPPPASMHHILITHSGNALTCEPETVTLTACANASCSALYTNNVGVSLSPGGGSYTISGGVNNTAQVSQSAAGSATLSASVTGDPAIGTTCLRTSDNSSSCSMNFATAGLDFGIADHLSESQQAFTVRALKQGSNTGACVAALSNTTQSVNFTCSYLNPSSTNPGFPASVRINSTPLGADAKSACSGGGANVNLAFDANGTATATLLYADAGQMNLGASLTLSGSQLIGSDSFIVSPAAFKFTAVQGSMVNPAAADANGAVFIPAGQAFTTTLAAVNALGATTYNFGRESTPEYPGTVTPLLVAPSGGAFPGLFDTAGHASSFPSLSNGSSSATMYYNEVGIISLTALLNNPSGYLNAGSRTTGTTNIGRFIPDHFNTAITSLQMDCTKVTGATKPCPAPNANGKFLYSRQPFDLAVTAYSASNASNASQPSGSVTTNYAGAFAKPVTIEAWNADPANLNIQNPPASPGGNAPAWKSAAGVAATAGFAAPAFTAGTANSATSGVDSHPEYDFAYAYPSAANLAAPVSLYLRARDSDSVTSLRAPNTGEALVSIVGGRLLVANNYGGLTSNMPVKVTAQYWSGSAYVTNPAYVSGSSVTLNAANVTFSNCRFKNNGGTCAAPGLQSGAALNFSNGDATFNLTPLSADGSVDIAVNPLIYLPSTIGRVTFGVYRAGPVVYMREVF